MSSVALAARNNAEWCEAVAATHGLSSEWDDGAWTCRARTPPLYPDAVTLRAGADPDRLLARIDTSAGCSIKDSFAVLDLRPHGFDILFEAQWISRPSTPGPRRRTGSDDHGWSVVRDPIGLARWIEAWRGDRDDPGAFRPHLLDLANVAVLQRRGASGITGGAIVSSTGPIAGFSNVFSTDPAPAATWAALPGVAATCFPETTACVGYESGADLAAAERAGFHRMGPLRIWLRSA